MQKGYLIGGLIFITGMVLIYFYFNPSQYNFFPKCPFHSLTGFDCPGCGSQRAIHALLTGNFMMALNYNLLLVISLPLVMLYYGVKLVNAAGGKARELAFLNHPVTPVIIAVTVVLFWIFRNIPVYPLTWLAA